MPVKTPVSIHARTATSPEGAPSHDAARARFTTTRDGLGIVGRERTEVTSPAFAFTLLGLDPGTSARRGQMTTLHGVVQTPAFMPVGTQASVKTLLPHEVRATGAQIILANTYHLMLRPGLDTLVAAGGLHRFMGWTGPILTDSGGFQIFSLAGNARVRETGVTFRSHIDGSKWELSPEASVGLQLGWGSDIVMALDHLVGLPADSASVREATDRTHRWLHRCVTAFEELGGQERAALFGICQGGMDGELRRSSAEAVADTHVDGCAIGGLSVGEPKPIMAEMLEIVTAVLPRDKPRYLMGVGSPEDLWMGVARGVDLFDCVLPTRLARNGALFTPEGRISIKHRRFANLHAPLDSECDCDACGQFSAAYLHHLFRAKEILGLRLASVHNLRFLARQVEEIRGAIERNAFVQAHAAFLERYRPVDAASLEEMA
jgi:queuine tRNA-ribosyltransferase